MMKFGRLISTEPDGRAPKGGFARTTRESSDGSRNSESSHLIGLLFMPTPWRYMFIEPIVTTSGVMSLPCRALFLRNVCSFSSMDWSFMCEKAESKKPPVPQAGSVTVSPMRGWTTSTMASTSGRGVKYCPAPLFLS